MELATTVTTPAPMTTVPKDPAIPAEIMDLANAPLFRGERSGLAELLDTAPFRFVGKVSLSAYLWHFPLMLLLGRWGLMAGDTVPGMLRNVALVLAVTLVVSAVTYYAVEEPVMKFAKRYRTRWS